MTIVRLFLLWGLFASHALGDEKGFYLQDEKLAKIGNLDEPLEFQSEKKRIPYGFDSPNWYLAETLTSVGNLELEEHLQNILTGDRESGGGLFQNGGSLQPVNDDTTEEETSLGTIPDTGELSLARELDDLPLRNNLETSELIARPLKGANPLDDPSLGNAGLSEPEVNEASVERVEDPSLAGSKDVIEQLTTIPLGPSPSSHSPSTPSRQFAEDFSVDDGSVSSSKDLKSDNIGSEVHPCHERVDSGVCRAYIPRWYFNATDGTCNTFAYGGCHGNKNNFNKEHKCYAACTGEIPCPSDPGNVCRMSESPCLNTTCPRHPEAECVVLPCTCQAVFEDSAGQVVDCENPSDGPAVARGGKVELVDEPDNATNGKEGRVANPKFQTADVHVLPEQESNTTNVMNNFTGDDEDTDVTEKQVVSPSTPEGAVTDVPEEEGSDVADVTESSPVPIGDTGVEDPVIVTEESTVTQTPIGNVTVSADSPGKIAAIYLGSLGCLFFFLCLIIYGVVRCQKISPLYDPNAIRGPGRYYRAK